MSVFGVFFGPYFLTFRLNKKIHRVNLHIQSECGRMGTRKFLNTDYFEEGNHLEYNIKKSQIYFKNLWCKHRKRASNDCCKRDKFIRVCILKICPKYANIKIVHVYLPPSQNYQYWRGI